MEGRGVKASVGALSPRTGRDGVLEVEVSY